MALTNVARSSRREFRENYSSTTAEILKRVARGQDSHVIAERVGVSLGTVATTKGNLTRGWYAPYAVVDGQGTVVGECSF